MLLCDILPSHYGERTCTTADLRSRECRWPYGEPDAQMRHCCARTAPGEVYCERHEFIARPGRRQPYG